MIQCPPAPPEGACEPNAATLRHANASHYDADSFSTLLSQKAEPTAAALKQLNAAHYEADSFSMLLSTREACSGCCAGSGADTFSPAPGQSAHASLVSDARAGLRSKPPKLGTIFDEHGRSHEDHRQSGGPKPLQGGHRRCTGRRRTGLLDAKAPSDDHSDNEGDVEWHVHTVDAEELERGERLAL